MSNTVAWQISQDARKMSVNYLVGEHKHFVAAARMERRHYDKTGLIEAAIITVRFEQISSIFWREIVRRAGALS